MQNYWNLGLYCKRRQLTGPVNYRNFRETGPWPAVQAYYGLAKIACLCSYCCYRHLWFYDSGRLWRVEIVTLRVGATVKEGKGQGEGRKKCGIFSRISPPPPPLTLTRPIFSSLLEFQQGAFASKNIRWPEVFPCASLDNWTIDW